MPTQELPLAGIGALVTRAPAQAKSLIEGLEALGASVMHLPVLAIGPVDARIALAALFAAEAAARVLAPRDGDPHTGVVWTSANAVTHGLPQLPPLTQELLQQGTWWSACVGDATAAVLRAHGIVPTYTAPRASALDLATMLCETLEMPTQHVLFPCSTKALPVLPEVLMAAGARVSQVPVYQPLAAEVAPGPVCDAIASERLHVLTFASPSTIDCFFEVLGDRGRALVAKHQARLCWAAIGKTTAGALKARGIVPGVVADPPGIPGLLAGVVANFGERDT